MIEEPDDDAWTGREMSGGEPPLTTEAAADRFEPLLTRLTRHPTSLADEEEQREAAELLHSFGTAEAVRRLGTRPGHERARALLRDTRWDSSLAGDVPLSGAGAFSVGRALVALRLRRAARMVMVRWAAASVGGGMAGLIAGAVGGLILAATPGSASPVSVAPVLAVIGAACGAVGGAGVGAGLSIAEAIADRGAASRLSPAALSAVASWASAPSCSRGGASLRWSGWTSMSAGASRASSSARPPELATRPPRVLTEMDWRHLVGRGDSVQP